MTMGQARLRRESLRQLALKKSTEWDFPTSQWEAEVCADLREEDVVVVSRESSQKLAWARMRPNECHQNVRWYVENDPSRNSQAVAGWWVQWPNFVLHSVVETKGQLVCITPSAFAEHEIPFIRDNKIDWVEEDGRYRATGNGKRVGVGVRRYPKFTMAQNAIIRERLIAGMDMYRASHFSDVEIEKLKKLYLV